MILTKHKNMGNLLPFAPWGDKHKNINMHHLTLLKLVTNINLDPICPKILLPLLETNMIYTVISLPQYIKDSCCSRD